MRRASADDPAAVARGREAHPAISQSVPFVGAPQVWSAGSTGEGEVVVVIDTGVAETFGGTLVGQACFAADSTGTVGHCGPGRDEVSAFDALCFSLDVCDGTEPFDADAARPCEALPGDVGCQHGTAVAAVAARHDAPSGVAPDAGVYGIQVFGPGGTNADLVDLLLALDHARALFDAGVPVASVNLSVVTSQTFAGHCDAADGWEDVAAAFRQLFDALEDRGIPTVVAAGNTGESSRIAMPACLSNAVAVGASDLDDDLAGFSSLSSAVDLVAPGAREGNGSIAPLVVPGPPSTAWAGTSFSAPHVAGAYALLDELYPKASARQLLFLLRAAAAPASTGSATYPRLRVGGPAVLLKGSHLFPSWEAVVAGSQAAVGDLDGDGRSDLLIHGPGSQPDGIYFGKPAWDLVRTARSISGSYTLVVGNFRGAPRVAHQPVAEEVLFHPATATSQPMWQTSASRVITSTSAPAASGRPIVGDLDGDGFDDITWYVAGSGADRIWFGGGSGFTVKSVSVSGTYRTAIGDLDCDGRDELVWHDPDRFANVDRRWDVGSNRAIVSTSATVLSTHRLLVANLDGDSSGGEPCEDLLRHGPGGDLPDLIQYGGPTLTNEPVTIAGDYFPFAGDFDGDGGDEVVFYRPGSGADRLWSVSPARARTSYPVTIAGTYRPLVGDFDGDGADDVVLHQAATTIPMWWGVPSS